MAFVEPVTLRDRGIRMEPLGLQHEEGLRQAAADGELWRIRVTSVPEPEQTLQYIKDALAMREAGNRFAFAIVDDATGKRYRPWSGRWSLSTRVPREAAQRW